MVTVAGRNAIRNWDMSCRNWAGCYVTPILLGSPIVEVIHPSMMPSLCPSCSIFPMVKKAR